MGLFREQYVLLTLFKWCGLIPYVPPASKQATIHRLYLLRLGLMLLVIGIITYFRLSIVQKSGLFAKSVTYIVWLLAVMVDMLTLVALLLLNGFNVKHYGTFAEQLDRLECVIDRWKSEPRRRCFTPSGWFAIGAMVFCVLFHVYAFVCHFVASFNVIMQIRWEVLLIDLYLVHVVFVLHAIGRRATHLRRMARDAVRNSSVFDLCAVLRLRDDLIRCVALLNRLYGVLFLCLCASWLISVTCIIYFDFVLRGLRFYNGQPYILEHMIMMAWKSALVGGLLAMASSVTVKIRKITQLTHCCGDRSLTNPPLTRMIDKMLLKCQFQDIRFTVYGLFTIDNSTSYTILSAIITYLVILTQFRLQEIEDEREQR